MTRPRWRARLDPAWQHPAGGCMCSGQHGPRDASAAGAGGARGCSRTSEPGPAEGRSRRDRDHSADTSYIPWRKSSHRDLRPAGRATRIHASDSLYAWAWYQRSGGGAAEERRHWRRTRGRRSYKLHTAAAPVEDRGRRGGSTGGGPGAAQRRRRRSGAGGHQESPQPESWTGGGADRAQTRRAGVYALLDWHNLPGRVTRLLRLEWGEGGHGWAGSKAVEATGSRVGRAADQDVPLQEFLPLCR